jgi:hypothetical protein
MVDGQVDTRLQVDGLHQQSPYCYPISYCIIICNFIESIMVDYAADGRILSCLKE